MIYWICLWFIEGIKKLTNKGGGKMTIEKLEEFLNEGEGYTLEYKESVNSLSDSVFETVSSFSNRYGGYILLGVKEVKRGNKKVGEVIGVLLI